MGKSVQMGRLARVFIGYTYPRYSSSCCDSNIVTLFTISVLKFRTLLHTFFAQILLFIQLFLKILSGQANSVDPDQTAPSGAV